MVFGRELDALWNPAELDVFLCEIDSWLGGQWLFLRLFNVCVTSTGRNSPWADGLPPKIPTQKYRSLFTDIKKLKLSSSPSYLLDPRLSPGKWITLRSWYGIAALHSGGCSNSLNRFQRQFQIIVLTHVTEEILNLYSFSLKTHKILSAHIQQSVRGFSFKNWEWN